MKAYKTTADLPLERRIKAGLGRLIASANPALAAKVRAKPFTRPLKHHERLLRNARQHQAIEEKDHETLHQFLIDYWSSPFSQEFFVLFENRFEELFLKYHTDIVGELSRRAVPSSDDHLIHLLELGCGDGKVLNYLADSLPNVAHFTGLDLSKEEIANCKKRFPDKPQLAFDSCDVFDWVKSFQGKDLILYTNGGVLEYFTRAQLISLFRLVREKSQSSWIVLTETLATDHHLDSEEATFPYGRELAFSHNYRAILSESGYSVEWDNDRFTKEGEENHPTRWLQLLAASSPRI